MSRIIKIPLAFLFLLLLVVGCEDPPPKSDPQMASAEMGEHENVEFSVSLRKTN